MTNKAGLPWLLESGLVMPAVVRCAGHSHTAAGERDTLFDFRKRDRYFTQVRSANLSMIRRSSAR